MSTEQEIKKKKRRKNSKSNLDMGRGQEVTGCEPLRMGFVSVNCVASMNSLPHELLVQILSFLPTKEAISTSLLSKRWRTLYAFTHNLDFDDSVFRARIKGNIQKSFDKFVNRRLAFQGVKHLKKVSMKIRKTYKDDSRIERWICNALEHGVSELHLHIESMWYRYLPSKVFSNTTLVKLSSGINFYINSVPSLPALKVLVLDSICFTGDQISDVFLAACPALEDLTIRYKYFSAASNVISSKTIKKLSVTYNYDYYVDRCNIITLDTPSVVDFYYYDYPRGEFPLCHLDSLAKATLNLQFLEDHTLREENNADVTNLISGIRNVKSLHLTISTVEVISEYCKGELPVFNNLVDLVFSSKKRGWKVLLPLLLERSPNLKTLVLSAMFVGIQIPPNNQIKMLSIMDYHGSKDEVKHISHFVLKMDCLEVVKVEFLFTVNDFRKMQLKRDLLKLPAASSRLKIQVI